MKLAIVQSTGNHQVDKIFAGVFGQVHDGIFHVAEELKKIHLFSLLTPEALKAQGIDLSDNVFELEVPDDAVTGVKSTLLHGLKASWMKAYTEAPVQAGFAKAALDSEAQMVRLAVEQAIQGYDLGVPAELPIMEQSFNSARTHIRYGENDDESDDYSDDVILGAYLDAKHLATRGNLSGTAWTPAAPGLAEFDSLPERSETDQVHDYASGVVQLDLQVFAAEGHGSAVAACLLQLPPEILGRLDCVRSARFASCEFHADNRNVMAPQADEAGGPVPEGDSSAGPATEVEVQISSSQAPAA